MGGSGEMRIAIRCWGSLFWDKRHVRLASEWKPSGSQLPIEFSRVSRVNGHRRLTLVIDTEHHSVPLMPVLFAESTPSDLKEAILDFAASEKHVDREDL